MRWIFHFLLLAVAFTKDDPSNGGVLWSGVNCGIWQDGYTKYHRQSRNRSDARRLIFVPSFSGLADKMTAIPTAFILALLTNRTFFITRAFGFSFHKYMTFPNIDPIFNDLADEFRYAPSFLAYNTKVDRRRSIIPDILDDWLPANVPRPPKVTHPTVDGAKIYNLTLNASDYYPICLRNNNSYSDFILIKSDLSSAAPIRDAGTIILESNRGVSYRTFLNPSNKNKLNVLGLDRDNSFGCIMHYLMRYNMSSCSSSHDEVSRAFLQARREGQTIIGVQIRTGDHVLHGSSPNMSVAEPYLKCAESLANHFSYQKHQKPSFYFVSDSVDVLDLMKSTFVDSAIVNRKIRPQHSAETQCGAKNTRPCTAKERSLHHKAILEALCDMHFFSKTDYQVISSDSNFGLVGAALNGRPLAGRVIRVTGPNPRCAEALSNPIGQNVDVETRPNMLATKWSGI
jgi:hypothetical protein